MAETNEQLEHCKAIFKSKYMGPEALSFHHQKIVLTIKSVTSGSEKGSDGSTVDGRIVHFEEDQAWVKPLWCGKHQCDLIIKAFTPKLGTDAKYHAKWIGEKVQLGICIESWFGKTEEYLRILPKLPIIELPSLEPSSAEAWGNAVNYIASGEGTIEAIKTKRKLRPEHEVQLQADVQLKISEGEPND